MLTKRVISRLAAMMCVLALACAPALAQTVNSIVVGRVVDPANASVASAAVTLTDQDTGAIRKAISDSSGNFRFPDVLPGTYFISIQVTGFKGLLEHGIAVSASETHDVGTLTLQIGNVTESVSVMATATPIQLGSSEQSQEIDANQLKNVTLKGRDLF